MPILAQTGYAFLADLILFGLGSTFFEMEILIFWNSARAQSPLATEHGTSPETTDFCETIRPLTPTVTDGRLVFRARLHANTPLRPLPSQRATHEKILYWR